MKRLKKASLAMITMCVVVLCTANVSGNDLPFVPWEDMNPSFLTGDINGDSNLDINDAIALFRHNMMPLLYPVSYTGSVDFTKDGTTDIADVIALFRYIMMPGIYPLS